MKTKNILFAIALVGNITCAVAQDVTVLHMKDGTTRRYVNGIKESTTIRFYEFSDASTPAPSYTTTHTNGYQAEWNVSEVWTIDGKYVVGVNWNDDVAANFQARHGLCFGTKPNLTIDNCDKKAYTTDSGGSSHTILIGEKAPTNAVRIDTPLEPGQTYFYRTFAEGKAEEGGLEKTVVFYGTERSFRVPRVMADFEYYPEPQATEAAMTAFAAHFPADVTAPTWEQIETLWNLWRASAEGQQTDISALVVTESFDDGKGYRINSIPNEFYTWIANREIVIDPFDVVEISKYYNGNDSVLTVTPDSVTNVDSKWGVPGGKYIRFTPVTTSTDHSFTYKSDEVVAGVRYKLQLNFAPETNVENVDAKDLYPTKVLVYYIEGNNKKQITLSTSPFTLIPTTESTSFEVDFSTTAMGLNLQYETNVSKIDIRKSYNRILRIAEARLIPIKDQDV